jgi:hypothetical protein
MDNERKVFLHPRQVRLLKELDRLKAEGKLQPGFKLRSLPSQKSAPSPDPNRVPSVPSPNPVAPERFDLLSLFPPKA